MSEPHEPEAGGWDRRRTLGAAAAGLAAVAVIALLVVGLANSGTGTSINDALAAGDRPDAPDLTLPVLFAADGVGPKGSEVALADLEGRTVVLNFWASWCPPCRDEAPLLDDIAGRYGGRGVLVLGLDTQDLSDNALGFIRQFGLTYPSLRDGSGDSEAAFEVTGLPETFILDAEGRIAHRHIGPVTRPEQLTRPLEQVL